MKDMKNKPEGLSGNNILMIVYAYPPIKAVGSLRPYFFSKCLESAGWGVHVFTTTNSRIMDSDRSFQGLVFSEKRTDLPTFDLMTLRSISKNIFKKRKGAAGGGSPGNPGIFMYMYTALRRFLRKLIRSFPFNIFYDGGSLFILSGVIKGVKYIKKHNIGYIYSTFSPYSVNITAFLLKILNRDLVWIADFRDLPFEDNDERIFMPWLQRRFSRMVFGKADCIVAISEGLGSRLKRYNKNLKVIKNGIPVDAAMFGSIQDKAVPADTFNIVHTGRLYYGKRDARLLFKTVKKLMDSGQIGSDVRLVYAGIEDNVWLKWAEENGLLENVDVSGLLDRKAALELQMKASINLVLTWSTEREEGIITAKFYEYLASNKPIICIINGREDREIERLYADINAGLVINNIPEEEEKLASFLKKQYAAWEERGHVKWEYNRGIRDALRYENLSKELEDIYLTIRAEK